MAMRTYIPSHIPYWNVSNEMHCLLDVYAIKFSYCTHGNLEIFVFRCSLLAILNIAIRKLHLLQLLLLNVFIAKLNVFIAIHFIIMV